MKHGKKLQRRMKELLTEYGFNPDNWLYIKNSGGTLVLVHKWKDAWLEVPYER